MSSPNNRKITRAHNRLSKPTNYDNIWAWIQTIILGIQGLWFTMFLLKWGMWNIYLYIKGDFTSFTMYRTPQAIHGDENLIMVLTYIITQKLNIPQRGNLLYLFALFMELRFRRYILDIILIIEFHEIALV